jgi:lipopolysaccharide biosynthesis glycosyltransferase
VALVSLAYHQNSLRPPSNQILASRSWFDCDSVLLNPKLGLANFLPPTGFDDVNILVTKDHNGLNNGIFFIRVSAWAVEVMAANLAYRTFNPDQPLKFQDQSALQNILEMPKFRDQVAYCPQRWFNAYQSGNLNETIEANEVRRGDLVVHFAGIGNKQERMDYWSDIAEQHLPDWEREIESTSYREEIQSYWGERKEQVKMREQELETLKLSANEFVAETDRNLTVYRDQLTPDEITKIDEAKAKVKDVAGKDKLDSISAAVTDLEEVRLFSSLRRVRSVETY